jgi:glycosyltransferase involved in cell wall biosynthesis
MQDVLERYLKKHALYPMLLNDPVAPETGIIICIPCYNEPNITSTLNSLAKSSKPDVAVAVILVLNQPKECDKSIDQINQMCYDDAVNWQKENNSHIQVFPYRLAFENNKHAGVGLARKVGMDEAIRQFLSIEKDGIIICLDADCQVEENYFIEIERFFQHNPKIGAVSINFEHLLDDLPEPLYTSILDYELHLRYYRHAQKYTGYPHAFYTIGSCMATIATSYAAYGGMNRRQAGEDFYFLSKFMEAGKMGEINTSTVFPSARMSDRVPFGTGRIIEGEDRQEFMTYSFGIFKEIKIFLGIINQHGWGSDFQNFLHLIPPSVLSFLEVQIFNEILDSINSNTSSKEAFLKRFFRWLNPLRFLKLVHHLRDVKYGKEGVGNEANELLKTMDYNMSNINLSMLEMFRKLDRESEK